MLSELLDELSQKIELRDDKSHEIFYRGIANESWTDTPGIFRNDNLAKESEIFDNVARFFPQDFKGYNSIDVLCQLQHYSAPTRLLDVTSNFLVALFFACGGFEQHKNHELFEDTKKIDGKIRIYSVSKEDIKSIDSETVCLLSNIARLKNNEKIGNLFWRCERDIFVWQNDDDLFKESIKNINEVFLAKTNLNNPRIVAQSGAFFIFGGLNKGAFNITRETQAEKTFLKMPKEYLYNEITIKSTDKERILHELNKICNIRYSTLFPEKQDFISAIAKEL